MIVIIKNCFGVFIILLIVLLILTLLCEGIFTFSISTYSKIQKFLIKHSNHKNQIVIGKLLILNYRIYKNFMIFILTIKPFRIKQDDFNNSYFDTKIFSEKTKRNLFVVFLCLISAIIISFSINNFSTIKAIFEKYINFESLKRIMFLLNENKWFVLSICSLFLLLYGFLKDKFINKIITEIHDEELKEIINTHKKLCIVFNKLYKCLCENIEIILGTSKYNGKVYALASMISDKFGEYEYNTDKDSFEKVSKTTELPCRLHDCKGISEYINQIENIMKNFKNSESFYTTSALNKYIHGLKGFDISYLLIINDKNNLICKEFVESELNNINFDNRRIISDDDKINVMNEHYNISNTILCETLIDTIEYAVDINNYIKGFKKSFSLKAKRKKLSYDEIIKFK